MSNIKKILISLVITVAAGVVLVYSTTAKAADILTLSAKDGMFQFSEPLSRLSEGQDTEIKFEVQDIYKGNSGFSNAIEFWCDDDQALVLTHIMDNGWYIEYFDGNYENENENEIKDENFIQLENNKLNKVEIHKKPSTVKFYLNGQPLDELDNYNDYVEISTRVVGTEVEFWIKSP